MSYVQDYWEDLKHLHVTIRPLVSKHARDRIRKVETKMRSRIGDEFTILYHPTLSTILEVNPQAIYRLPSDKEFLLKQSVDSVLISNVDYSPILACDVSASGDSKRKRTLLGAANIPYLNLEGVSDERLSETVNPSVA